MLKKTISYEDYDGNKRTEDFYFNLNKSEITELQVDMAGGIENYLHRISQKLDGSAMLDVFTMFIKKSYGEKSDDGKHFRKSPAILDDFMSTPAYDILFEELANPAKFRDFLLGIIPADVRNSFNEADLDKIVNQQ